MRDGNDDDSKVMEEYLRKTGLLPRVGKVSEPWGADLAPLSPEQVKALYQYIVPKVAANGVYRDTINM